MEYLSGIAILECTECQHHLIIDAKDLDVEESGAEDRNMGLEVFYFGEASLVCIECGKGIEVNYDASEYPIGIANYSDTSCTGARIIQGFGDINIFYEDTFYNYEPETQLFIPEQKKIITDLCSGVTALISEINKNPLMIYEISPREFEEIIAHVFSKSGFVVELTKRTRDKGRDIIAIKSELGINLKYLIECKRYAKNHPIGVSFVRALYGVHQQEGANKSIIATTSRFTKDAKEFATAQNTTKWAMDLKEYNDILAWIKPH